MGRQEIVEAHHFAEDPSNLLPQARSIGCLPADAEERPAHWKSTGALHKQESVREAHRKGHECIHVQRKNRHLPANADPLTSQLSAEAEVPTATPHCPGLDTADVDEAEAGEVVAAVPQQLYTEKRERAALPHVLLAGTEQVPGCSAVEIVGKQKRHDRLHAPVRQKEATRKAENKTWSKSIRLKLYTT